MVVQITNALSLPQGRRVHSIVAIDQYQPIEKATSIAVSSNSEMVTYVASDETRELTQTPPPEGRH